MFGHKAVATKAFVIILLILSIVWILYSFNFSLPKINFQIDKAPKKEKRDKEKSTRYEEEEEEEEEEDSSSVIRGKSNF
jgi:hypothetical protein